jgi:C4-dicarboxylate transporter DctM subunit
MSTQSDIATSLPVPHRGALDILASANEVLVVAALIADLLITFTNTISRYVFSYGFDWALEASLICMAIMTFPGAAAFYRRGSGMAYTALVEKASLRGQELLGAIALWFVAGICAVSLYVYPAFFEVQAAQLMAVLDISNGYVAIWLGVGLALMLVFTIEKMSRLRTSSLVGGFAAVAAITAAILLFRWAFDAGLTEVDPFVPILMVLAVSFLVGTPLAFILALGGLLYLIITSDAPMVMVPASYQAGIGSFVLTAIPFFMLAGALMDVTGMAGRLVDMIQEWVGHWRGGLLQAQMVAIYVFSGISGSKVADMATVGGIMKEPLKRRGYKPTESVAVLAAAAAMGEVIPPSIMLLLLGSITTLSVGSLFLARIFPAALLALALSIGIAWRSRKYDFPKGPPFDLRRALRSIPHAAPALMVPVIVVGGIVGGIASPTESSSFAVIYGFLAALVVYHSVQIRPLWHALRDASVTAGMVLFMVGTANLLTQSIVLDGLARHLAAVSTTFQSQTEFLFLSVLALIIIGFVLEGLPAILIAGPILIPVAEKLHIDTLQYGILLVMAIGIGVFMPPIGIGYYMACTLGDAPAGPTMRPSLVYNVFLIVGLIAAILLPQVTLWLPHTFGLH